MTVKEAAEAWNCSETTVREYCSSGIIPLAEKGGLLKRWSIPDVPKPPATRHKFVFYMHKINDIQEGADLDFTKYGDSIVQIQAIYTYLADHGFITRPDNNGRLNDVLKETRILHSGIELIRKEETKQPKKRKKNQTEIDFRLGTQNNHIQFTHSSETESETETN